MVCPNCGHDYPDDARFCKWCHWAPPRGGTLGDKEGDGYKYLPFTEEKAVEALTKIIEGLNAIHSKGLVHGNITPDNLLYTGGGGVALREAGTPVQTGTGMTSYYTEEGNEGYEAPELFAVMAGGGARINPAIDYYALGITLWVLLTGKEPFVDENGKPLPPDQIRRDAVNGETMGKLISRSPELSAPMSHIIRGLLTGDPERRWGYQEVTDHLAGKKVPVWLTEAQMIPKRTAAPEVMPSSVPASTRPETVARAPSRELPPLDIAGMHCCSLLAISQALVQHPAEGKELIFGGKLVKHLYSAGAMDMGFMEIADKISDMIDDYSAKGKEDEGLVAVAALLASIN